MLCCFLLRSRPSQLTWGCTACSNQAASNKTAAFKAVNPHQFKCYYGNALQQRLPRSDNADMHK